MNGGYDWNLDSEIRQLYRVMIVKFEKEGKDTSRLEKRLKQLDEKLWLKRKKIIYSK